MSLESELYARLKELRQQLAVEKKLPAYCIFSNKALLFKIVLIFAP